MICFRSIIINKNRVYIKVGSIFYAQNLSCKGGNKNEYTPKK